MMILERRSLTKSQIINKLIVHTAIHEDREYKAESRRVRYVEISWRNPRFAGSILRIMPTPMYLYRYYYHPSVPLREVLENRL